MIIEIKNSAEQKMQKSLEALKLDFSKVRSGRPHTGLLDHIVVDYYGVPTPIKQLANVILADARTIGVVPWEKKLMAVIEKAIRDSDLGLNPSSVGEMVRVPMPALTEERRRDLTKIVKAEAENARVAMRNIRRDSNAQLKELLRDKLIAEDDDRRGQEDIQKLINHYISEVDKLLQSKESELMAV
ncbi:MAG: ribosome recycling factor [Nitrosomonas sp.]|jgi:ribosome recycling factor|nr:ribosome recycling factor [Nitrosomonas sp.]MCC7135732.1 ribosome recycling factor [Nitrosomonas sp.]